MKVSVSYLKSNYSLEETIEKIERSSCDFIHLDLIDGVFVGEKNYTMENIIKIFNDSRKPLDIHCMINDPSEEIECFSILQPAFITVHHEIKNFDKCLKKIKGLGMKCGIALNPDTSIEEILPYLQDIDLVLVMSVYPGKGGQRFMESSIDKCMKLNVLRGEQHLDFIISIDGGINDETVDLVRPYVDMVVSGSYICMSKDYDRNIMKLR